MTMTLIHVMHQSGNFHPISLSFLNPNFTFIWPQIGPYNIIEIFYWIYYSDDSESEIEELSTLEVKQTDSKHKRTGLPLTELNINADQMKLPPNINQTI